MKLQRPTIPIAIWKLATDLQATRAIQNQQGTPAYNCNCQWCIHWRNRYESVLPTQLQQQLLRIGINLNHPTDLYKMNNDKNSTSIRVVFHAVGKILEGANPWCQNDSNQTLMYVPIQKQPYVSLVVLPQNQYHGAAPILKDQPSSQLIRIDLRLELIHA